jgi:hypothetical protein
MFIQKQDISHFYYSFFFNVRNSLGNYNATPMEPMNKVYDGHWTGVSFLQDHEKSQLKLVSAREASTNYIPALDFRIPDKPTVGSEMFVGSIRANTGHSTITLDGVIEKLTFHPFCESGADNYMLLYNTHE